MKRSTSLLFLLSCGLTVENLFADVATLKTGSGEITGNITGNATEIRIQTPGGVRMIPVNQVFSIRFGSAETEPAPLPLPAPVAQDSQPAATVQATTLPVGTSISVRTIDAIDSKTGNTEREYAASLDEPVVVNQVTVAPTKMRAVLKIREIKPAGKLKGSTTLSLQLVAITINGQRVVLETGDVVSASSGKGKTTALNGAIGAAGGCGIGVAVGGAVGCGVGGVIGGASGIAASILFGKTVKIPPETRLTFKLEQPVVVTLGPPPSPVPLTATNTDSPSEAALIRGEAHRKASEFADALKEYQSALEVNPRSSLAHYQIGLIFWQQGNLDAASNELREALNGDLDPRWVLAWAHIRLGQIFDQVGKRDRAINEYVQAVQTGDNADSAQHFATDRLRTPCRGNVCPDTLTLRNGTSVSGGWLGVDDAEIELMTDQGPQNYAKSDALVVTFASVATVSSTPAIPSAPATAAAAPSPARAQAPQVVYGPEPEWLGAVYLRDESGKFIPLQRSTATYLPTPVGIVYTGAYRDFYAIDGLRSSVRLKSDQKMMFVVRLANGVDPRIFNLYPLATKKGARITKLDPKRKTLVAIPLNVTRVGASSYGLVPDAALPAGEYAFSPKGSNDAYCFGIDP